MIQIRTVTVESSFQVLDQARGLFRAYGEFLLLHGGPELFNFSRLEEEILDLPAAYTHRGGELLLATEGAVAAGCIAYRSLESSGGAEWCEIKRLFVDPQFRSQGIGKRLIREALFRAQVNGYQTACLDTEPHSMAVAKQIYLDLGFVEDVDRRTKAERDVVIFFKKTLDKLAGRDC